MSRSEELLSQMTVEEKADFVGGSAIWYATGIPRLGIPRLKVTDGPIGARGGNLGGGLTAACFPNGSALAATFDPELIEAIGGALGEEAKTKRCHVLLGPTVNMHRSPLGGRHFECYSEDPYLTSRIAVAFVRGVQSRGVGTSVKHFVCNDSEFERHSISSDVDERALREIYLAPFEATVKETQPWTLMSAYNKINGVEACEHEELQIRILKEEWGFEGFLVSDWGAVKDTVGAANGGLDLEMPGPPRHFGAPLAQAVKDGRVDESVLDDKVRRILGILEKSGAFEQGEEQDEEAVDRPEHRALARCVAQQAAVLLKNENDTLPLQRDGLRKLAVIGPNARGTCIQGGGSARVLPHYEVSFLDGLREAAGGAEVVFEPGCTSHKTIPAPDPTHVTAEGTPERPGFRAQFFGAPDLSGDPVRSRVTRNMEQVWFGSFDPAVPAQFSARFEGRFTPTESGGHTFALTSAGKSRLLMDGELAIDNWTRQERGDAFFGLGSREEKVEIPLTAGEPVQLTVEYSNEGLPGLGGLKFGHLPPQPDDMLERAVAAARDADAAVVVVGLNADWETEGHDRASLELPGRQAELIEKVAAANPRTVVAVNAGAPIDMGWIDRVPAALWTWYPGQEAGHALADLVFGDANPSGRLPTTFPARIEDTPSYGHYPGEGGKVVYGESTLVGYRHYDANQIEPRFPFGHGLSYTRFEYGDLEVPATTEAERGVEIRVSVRNAGEVAGSEVVQAYLSELASSLPQAPRELAAFARVTLEPGEAKTAVLQIAPRALASWDPERHGWVTEPGEFEVAVGASSRDLRVHGRFRLGGEA